MAHKIFFTYELVQTSPSERQDKYIIYRTPFGVVREHENGSLEINKKNEWIPLQRENDSLLLVYEKTSVGLAPKIVYDSNWDYIKSRIKTYKWLILLLFLSFLVSVILESSTLWMTGLFIILTSVIVYQERGESGIRQALVSFFFGVLIFIALIFLIEIIYTLLYLLQSLMGLCDGKNCTSPNIWLTPPGEYDPGLTGGEGRYGI